MTFQSPRRTSYIYSKTGLASNLKLDENGDAVRPYTSVGNKIIFEVKGVTGTIGAGASATFAGHSETFTFSGSTWLRLLTWCKSVPVKGSSALVIERVRLGMGPGILHPTASTTLSASCEVEVGIFNNDEDIKLSRSYTDNAFPYTAGQPHVQDLPLSSSPLIAPVLNGETAAPSWNKMALRIINTDIASISSCGFAIYIEATEL